MAEKLGNSGRISLTKIIKLLGLNKSSFYYRPIKKLCDEKICKELQSLAATYKTWGFTKMMAIIKEKYPEINHKRIYRLYRFLGLNMRIKPKKRIPKDGYNPLFQPIRKNICWSGDFMSDALLSCQKFRSFNVIDDFNRESLTIKIDFCISSKKVTDYLDEIGFKRGFPEMMRFDNGPEFTSNHMKNWAKKRSIKLLYIQPGKPSQNGFIERFNRTYREDILDCNIFNNLEEVELLTKVWMEIYNEERPHESLGNKSPKKFAQKMANKGHSCVDANLLQERQNAS